MKRNVILSLLDRTEALERRLWAGEPPPGGRIPDGELSRILHQAGQRFFARNGEDQTDALSLELTEAVNEIIDERAEQQGVQLLLSVRHAALAQLVENLFRYLEYSNDLDSEAFDAIRGLQVCAARIALEDASALDSPASPLRQLLELCLRACQGCDHYAGFRAQALLAQLGQVTGELLSSPLPPLRACHESLRRFDGYYRQLMRQLPPADPVMLRKERDQALQERVRQDIRAQAFGVLSGKRLPRAALEFFDQIWSEYLLGPARPGGDAGPAWEKGVAAVHSLVESLGVRDPEQMLTCYSGPLTEVLEEFRQGAEQVRPNSPITRRFQEQMDAFCLQVLNGEEPAPEQMIEVPEDAYHSERMRADDAAEIERLDSMEEGAWYLIEDGGIRRRARLVHLNREDQYCLFVNYSGIRAARMDFRRVAEGLESATIRPLDVATAYKRALRYAVKQIADFVPQLESKVQAAEAAREQQLEAEIEKQREAESLRQLAERQSREAAAARKRARREAAERARRQAEKRAEAARAARERVLDAARGEVERMQPGGRLELILEDGARLVCELGMRLGSSRKMIFIDEFGRRQLSVLPDELAEKIAAGNGRILDFGTDFDDTLRSLIVEHSSRISVE